MFNIIHGCVNTLLELHKMYIKNWMTIKKKASRSIATLEAFLIKKEGGFLLSRIALQYHRRKWA